MGLVIVLFIIRIMNGDSRTNGLAILVHRNSPYRIEKIDNYLLFIYSQRSLKLE
jgi:hypothetical protein